MYGIKGYIFISSGDKMEINNPPFEAITGYEKGHEFIKTTIETLETIFAKQAKDNPLKVTGYMFTLTKEE